MAADEEAGAKKPFGKKLSSGKLLVDDPGWLGPLNALVWASPNSMLYIMLVVGTIVWYIIKNSGRSTGSFLGAALVELLLSTDNICLFHQIFEHFRVPREVRPGLLFVGTPFMMLMRYLLFFAMKGIYESIRPMMFAIGLFCAYQGGIVLWLTMTGQSEDEEDFDAESSGVVMWFKKIMGDRLMTKYKGSAFWVVMDGVAKFTPMFLVLIAVEITDVAFCVDGVSTIFMVDHEHISTIFIGDIVAAVMVRALYPQLAGTVELFPDLNYAVAVVLLLVGGDMCAGVLGYDLPPGILALSMAVLFALGMISSVLRGVCRVAEAKKDEATANAEEHQQSYGAVGK
mmetsp:Transcript_3332/g.11555  ORF Transcript_3332/g.11555 Transcript_3332/m.11555 type:complete len:342 (-) Transcript_3332:2088-3113(-)